MKQDTVHFYSYRKGPNGARLGSLYYTNWTLLLGDGHLHELNGLLELNLSDSLKERLKKARPGTEVPLISKLSANESLVVRRLTEDEVQMELEQAALEVSLKKTKQEILENIPKALLEEEKRCEKALEKIKKAKAKAFQASLKRKR